MSAGMSYSSALGGPLAQLAEQQTLNLRVRGSSPWRLTTSFLLNCFNLDGFWVLPGRRLPSGSASRHSIGTIKRRFSRSTFRALNLLLEEGHALVSA